MIPVTIKGLTKDFGDVRALDGICLSIEKGELFFLLGPSGCGKTTLLRCIAGLCVPSAGSIHFADRDVTSLPPQKRDTGMVFQSYALWPHMTVEGNVAFGLKVRGLGRAECRRRAAEALDLIKMGGYARRKPNQLSGGQQQRVALARALVVRPQCLLLDEPLSNLDAKLRLDMRTEIRRLCKQFGLTAIYVTHDQKEAMSVADRMAVMFRGQVSQIGPPRELYRRPNGSEIADFLGETNLLDASIDAANGAERVISTSLGLLAANAPAAPESGRCAVSIRPEAVIVPADDNAANQFNAHIVERVYLGEATQLTLAVNDVRLRARVTEHEGVEELQPGCAVRCAVDTREIVILRE